MNNFPLVSVITPTYKRPEKLPRAIDSVLNQTYPNVEIIVVDDNNPDTEGRKLTEEIMSQYASNSRVKYVKHAQNKNGAAARNTGARLSDAKYIALLDDDDEFMPEKIASQVKRLEELPSDYKLCYSRYIIKKWDGTEKCSSENREGALYLDSLYRELHLCAGSNLLIEKEAFDSIGGFDESFRRNQDLELLTRLLMKYKLAYTPTVGVIVYFHNDHKYFDPVEVTKQYYTNFKSIIDSLDERDRKMIDRKMNQQLFSDYVVHHKSFKKGCEMLLHREISIFDALRVLCNRFYKHFKKTA